MKHLSRNEMKLISGGRTVCISCNLNNQVPPNGDYNIACFGIPNDNHCYDLGSLGYGNGLECFNIVTGEVTSYEC